MKHALAALLQSPGMCWGDESSTAQPHRFSAPVIHEAPDRKPLPTLLVFPVSVGAAEPIGKYRHDCRARMLKWTASRLHEKPMMDEHAAYVIASDLAVAEIGRALHGVEGELLTSCVRDVFNVMEAQRMYRPGKLFSR